jgi:hypothetical protein
MSWCHRCTQFDRIETMLILLTRKVDLMSQQLEDLKAAIAAEDDALAKLVAFAKGVPALVAAAVAASEAGDAAALTALTADVQAQSAAVLAALPAPVAPPAPPAGVVPVAPI